MGKRQILVIGSITTCLPAGRHKKPGVNHYFSGAIFLKLDL
jgi:hypothetical protein